MESGRVGARRPALGGRRPARAAMVAGLLLALAAAAVFGALGEDVTEREPIRIDGGIAQVLHSHSSAALDAAMTLVSLIGSSTVVVPLLLLVVLAIVVWRRERVGEALFLATAYAGSGLLNALLKLAFHRARPHLPWSPVTHDFSFPSGHSMNSLVFYVGLAAVVWLVWGRRAGLVVLPVAVAIVLLVGVSRVYLGYHYVSDVIGGYSAGLLWLLLWAGTGRLLWQARPRRAAPL